MVVYVLDQNAPLRIKLNLRLLLSYDIRTILHYKLLADRGLLWLLQKIIQKIIQARVYRHVIYENVPTAVISGQLTTAYAARENKK